MVGKVSLSFSVCRSWQGRQAYVRPDLSEQPSPPSRGTAPLELSRF